MKLEMEVGVIKINGNNGGGVGLWLQHRNGGSAACHLLCTPGKIMGKGADTLVHALLEKLVVSADIVICHALL